MSDEIKREMVETLLRLGGERCGWCCGPGGEWWLSTDGKTLVDTATDAHIRELLAAAEARVAEAEEERVPMPAGLHPSTKQLVVKFAKAMAAKLRRAEMRYGYSDEWANAENIDGMRREFWSHADKGDPVDVANFAAFLWHHSQSTCGNPLAREIERLQTAIRRGLLMGNPDNIRRELRAALTPAADASGEGERG